MLKDHGGKGPKLYRERQCDKTLRRNQHFKSEPLKLFRAHRGTAVVQLPK